MASEGSGEPKRSHLTRPSVAAASVFIFVMAASIIPFAIIRHLASAQDTQTLQDRATAVRQNVNNGLNMQHTAMRSVGISLAANDSPAAFQKAAEQLITSGNFTYLAVLGVKDGKLYPINSVGIPTADYLNHANSTVTLINVSRPFATTGVYKHEDHSFLGLAYGQPIAPPNDILYGEVRLNTFDPATARAVFGDFHDIDNALYAGPVAPENLLYSSTTALPLKGKQTVSSVAVGSNDWTLVTKERHAIGDQLARAVPWIILGASFLIALLTAAAVSTSFKRRDSALASVDERAQENLNILEAASEAFITIDRSGVITRWSGQAEALFGWSAEEAIGRKGVETLLPMSEIQQHAPKIIEFFKSGEFPEDNRRVELTATRKDGTGLPIELNIWVTTINGRQTFNAIAHSIAERRQAAEHLAAVTQRALEASQLKSEFLANMSHEIRTPMNGVIGMTSLLLASDLTPEQREQAQTVRKSAESLLTVINDILDFSKVEAGRLEIRYADFNVRHLIDETINMLSSMATHKGLKLIVKVTESVPEFVKGDSGRIRQILLNIVGNAVKFTDTGSVTITCDYEMGAASHLLHFEVIDTGIGIPTEARARLFDSFVQVDMSSARKHEGTGLGLAISSQLVELMNGEIGVRSEPGQGSTFWFTVSVEEASSSPSSKFRQRPTRLFNFFEPNILVVEDNAVNQRVAALTLEMLGCKVQICDQGQEAVERVRSEHFDVIFMDCQMPEMDGYEATRLIRQIEPADNKNVVIAMTASAMQGDRDRAMHSGMNDYMTKPIRIEDFVEALTKWLSPDLAVGPIPQTQPLESEPAIDLTVLHDLRERTVGNPDIYKSLIDTFVTQATESIKAIQDAHLVDDKSTMRQAAHKLKGSSSTVGAIGLAHACADVERLSADGSTDDASAAINELVAQLATVKQVLSKETAN